MTLRPLVIYGAGGHGKVVANVVERQGRYHLAGFLDELSTLHGETVGGFRVLGGLDLLTSRALGQCEVIVALGDACVRRELSLRIAAMGYRFGIAIDPSAQIGREVELGPGTVVMPNAVINAGSRVGGHVIVNTAATIDHDCVVGDFCHLSPGVHLAGQVILGEGVHFGTSASAIPGVRVGDGSIVGAGGAVTENIPPHTTAVGVPARVIKFHQPTGELA